MAAAPFLQAIFSELGNRVGITVGGTLEDAVSRLRRLRGDRQEDHESTADQKIEFVECAGWIVMIEPDVPVEALGHLYGIRGATVHDFREKLVENYVIAWRDDAWRFVPVTEVTVEGYQWNGETSQWEVSGLRN
ncbi:hypothetical protein [Streptomyces sp. NPDC055099]